MPAPRAPTASPALVDLLGFDGGPSVPAPPAPAASPARVDLLGFDGAPSAPAKASAEPAPQRVQPAAAEVFALGDDEDEELIEDSQFFGQKPPGGNDFWAQPAGASVGSAGSAASGSTPAKAAAPAGASDDWYLLNPEDASELEQRAAATAGPAAASAKDGGSGKKGASALWSSALKFGSKAKKAIVQEAKLVADDARDLAVGVREGVNLTAQDAKVLQEKLKEEAKKKGLVFSGATGSRSKPAAQADAAKVDDAKAEVDDMAQDDLLAAICSTDDLPDTSAGPAKADAEGSSAPAENKGPGGWQAIRQGLASTAEVSKEMWRDIRDVNQDVMGDMKTSVADIRKAVAHIPLISGTAEASDAPDAAAAASNGLWGGLRKVLVPYPGSASSQTAAAPRFYFLPSARANWVKLDLSEQVGCFRLAVCKDREGVKLGLGIQDLDNLPVVDAVREGYIGEWNRANPPEYNVRLGDTILEVNGESGTYQELVALIKANKTLEMLIHRGSAADKAKAADAPQVAASASQLATGKEASDAAARRMRKLGGALASRTKKAITKAQEVGQVIQDTASAPIWRPGAGPDGGEGGAAEADNDGDIFEIGDDGSAPKLIGPAGVPPCVGPTNSGICGARFSISPRLRPSLEIL